MSEDIVDVFSLGDLENENSLSDVTLGESQ